MIVSIIKQFSVLPSVSLLFPSYIYLQSRVHVNTVDINILTLWYHYITEGPQRLKKLR